MSRYYLCEIWGALLDGMFNPSKSAVDSNDKIAESTPISKSMAVSVDEQLQIGRQGKSD